MIKGFFDIKTAQDLLDKLKREYARLQKSPLDQDVAFNFFTTAEHIADWLYPGHANKSKRTNLRNSNLVLEVCSHIANGLKHFKVEAIHHKSVSGTSSKSLFNSKMFNNKVFNVMSRLVIDLKGDAAKQLGPSIDVSELARQILEFWEHHMRTSS